MSAQAGRFLGALKLALCALTFALLSCMESAPVDSVLRKTLSARGELFLPAQSGNVVISHTNQTGDSVPWTVLWQKADTAEPSVFVATTEPEQTCSVAVEGPVKAITVGSFDGQSPGAVVGPNSDRPIAVSYPGPVLLAGVDFRDGDIISYTVADQAGGEFVITVEITAGG